MSEQPTSSLDLDALQVRLADDLDHPALRDLFQAGLLEGHVPGNDTGADLEQLREAYFSDEGQSAFWVADYKQQIVGMVGVQKTAEDAAEVRRLRVREGFRRKGVGAKLMEEALRFCQHHSYLKIVLDVRIERGPAIALFEKFGFQLARTREVEGRKMLDFYIDLYRDPGT